MLGHKAQNAAVPCINRLKNLHDTAVRKVRSVERSVPEAPAANSAALDRSSAPSTSDSVADAHKAEEVGASLCVQNEAHLKKLKSGWLGILRGGKP